MAQAPPLTLTLFGSRPSQLMAKRLTAAKTSLISKRSLSDVVSSALTSAVVDGGSVGGGDGAVFLEDRIEVGEPVEVDLERLFVVGDSDRPV